MNVNPCLLFDGNCREAFDFHANCLGADIKAMLGAGDLPADPARHQAPDDRIVHAAIDLGGSLLMASDWMGSAPFQPPNGFNVALAVDSRGEAERVFTALAEGGEVRMPLDQTFFSDAFGMLVDRFGVPWMINCAKTA